MQLTFSHVDILFEDLEAPMRFYQNVLGFKATPVEEWVRGDFRVESTTLFNGDQRVILVKPLSGILRNLLDEKGNGFTYRHAYTTPNLRKAYADLVAGGIQPVNENAETLSLADLRSPIGIDILWLPQTFGSLSIELIEENGWAEIVGALRNTAI